MIKQTLKVVPHGLIQSGQVIITADEKSGIVDLSETVVAGIGFFNKTISAMKEFKLINPSLLLSSSIKPGMKLSVGGVTLEVQENNLVNVVYVNGEDSLSGTAGLDLSGHYFEILFVHLNGKLDGYTVELELTAEQD